MTFILFILAFLIILAFSVEYLSSSSNKGKDGEKRVIKLIQNHLNEDTYKLINNVTLYTGNGTTQIDHIVVSEYGVFVIETKNMSGWIYGDKNQKTWTQKFHRSSFRFQNPLRQNYKHTETVKLNLSIKQKDLFSVVVFVGDCEIKTEMPENVVEGSFLIKYIKSKTNKILSKEEVNNIIYKIELMRLEESRKTDRKHVQHLNKKFGK